MITFIQEPDSVIVEFGDGKRSMMSHSYLFPADMFFGTLRIVDTSFCSLSLLNFCEVSIQH